MVWTPQLEQQDANIMEIIGIRILPKRSIRAIITHLDRLKNSAVSSHLFATKTGRELCMIAYEGTNARVLLVRPER